MKLSISRETQGKTQGHDLLQFSAMKSSKQDYLDSIDAIKEGKSV
jgi:hypothetical protein